jgi:hypothetical protein
VSILGAVWGLTALLVVALLTQWTVHGKSARCITCKLRRSWRWRLCPGALRGDAQHPKPADWQCSVLPVQCWCTHLMLAARVATQRWQRPLLGHQAVWRSFWRCPWAASASSQSTSTSLVGQTAYMRTQYLLLVVQGQAMLGCTCKCMHMCTYMRARTHDSQLRVAIRGLPALPLPPLALAARLDTPLR